MRRLVLLLLAALLAGCDATAEGTRAWRAGRFDAAHAAFVAAEERAGAEASAVLQYDRALAALQVGDLADAEAALARAEEHAAGELVPLVGFLRGNVAFARARLAAAQALDVEAEPFAFDVAIEAAKRAGEAWRGAAATRADWPAARRNAERAALLLAELERRKADAEAARQRRTAPRPRPRPAPPAPPPPPAGRTELEPDTPAPHLTELPPAEVLGVLERLAAQEREKLASRRRERSERSPGVEKDW